MKLSAVNICNKEQVVCHDGPGIKSPVLQLIYNHSTCLSSTFQMLCKFSRTDNTRRNVPLLQYHTMRARADQVKNLVHITNKHRLPLQIHDSYSRGTTKYIYFHDASNTGALEIWHRNVSFPYMLYEGNSCMYGDIYIIQTSSSGDSEILSLCTALVIDGYSKQTILIEDLRNVSIVIIHYGEYSTERIRFYAYYQRQYHFYVPLSKTYTKEKIVKLTVPNLIKIAGIIPAAVIKSYQLNLREIQYINITLEKQDIIELYFNVLLDTNVYEHSCCIATIFYSTHVSNMIGRSYDEETIDMHSVNTRIRHDVIRSIFINMNTRNLLNIPFWTVHISKHEATYHHAMNTTFYNYLPTDVLHQSYNSGFYSLRNVMVTVSQLWVIVHMVRPKDVSPYAI